LIRSLPLSLLLVLANPRDAGQQHGVLATLLPGTKTLVSHLIQLLHAQ